MKGRKGKLTSVHLYGNLGCEWLLSGRRMPGQTVPSTYLRTVFQPRLDIGVIPLTGTCLISTEQGGTPHQLNNYSLGFDHLLFRYRLQQQILQRRHQEDSLLSADSLLIRYKKLASRQSELKRQISSSRYQRELEKNRRIIQLAGPDSLRLPERNIQLDQAHLQVAKHDTLLDELRTIEKDMPSLEAYSRYKNIRKTGAGVQTPDIRKEAKSYGLYKPGYDHLMALKHFEIGNTAPDYSELTLKGTSLTGINIEYNPRNFYTAFAYGKTVAAFANPFGFALHSGRQILTGRIGYGQKEGSLICATLLKGFDGRNSYVRDQNYMYYEPTENTVLSLQGRWKWKEYVLWETEYAGSISNARRVPAENPGNANKQAWGGNTVTRTFNEKGHQAFQSRISTTLSETGTDMMLMYRQVQGQYYTFGNPFLRTDNKRVEGKFSQYLLKHQLKTTFILRLDEDNTLNQKQHTTLTRIYGYVFDLHLRNKPFVILSYNPSAQQYKGSDRYLSRTRIYTLTTGYVYKIRRLVHTTTFVHSGQQISSQLFNWNYQMQVQSLSHQVLFKNGTQLYTTGTIAHAQGKADSVQMVTADAGVNWTKHKKYRLSTGALYMNNKQVQQRFGVSAGIGMPVGKTGTFDLRCEEHWIDEQRKGYHNRWQTIARVRLNKNF